MNAAEVAPDVVIACPHCGALARVAVPPMTLLEPPTTVSWTDGYRVEEGVPAVPNVTRCQGCKKVFWLGAARQIGVVHPEQELSAEQVAWGEAPRVAMLDDVGYFEALDTGLAQTPEQELELRVFAWWRGNDRFRQSEGAGRFTDDERARKNMERLVELCAEGDHEILLFRAEALRQLGRFEEADDALCGLCSDYALAREKMRELIAAKSRDLHVLFG